MSLLNERGDEYEIIEVNLLKWSIVELNSVEYDEYVPCEEC